MAGVEWVFNLMDEVSKPARTIDEALGGLEKHFHEMDAVMRIVEARTSNFGNAMYKGGMRAEIFGFQLGTVSDIVKTVARDAVEVVEKIGEMGLELGKTALDAAEMKRSLLLSFETLTGGSDGAVESLEMINKAANKAGVNAEFLAGQYRDLLGRGFSAKNAQDIMAAALDTGAQSGKGQEAIGELDDIIGRIQSLDKIQSKGLDPLGKLGLSRAEILHSVADIKNITDAAAGKLLESGKLSSNDAITAILETVQRVADGGEALGTKAINVAAGSPTQQLTVLGNRFHELFADISVGPLASGLAAIAGYLDKDTDTGQRFRTTITGAFDSIFGWIGKLLAGNDLGTMFDKATAGLDHLVNFGRSSFEVLTAVFKGVSAGLGPLGSMLTNLFVSMSSGQGPSAETLATIEEVAKVCTVAGEVVAGLAGIFLASASAFFALPAAMVGGVVAGAVFIYDEFGAMVRWFEGLGASFGAAGVHLVEGLWDGIKSGWATLISDFEGLVQMLPASVRQVLGIHSPSRVMMELGDYTAQGFDQGLQDGGMGGGLDVTPELSFEGGGVGGGRSISFGDITIIVQGGGDQASARKQGEEAAKSFQERMEDFFEGLALETSGAPR